jgi:hypothetical protein
MRSALWATAVWNLGAAFLFGFPETLGRIVQLPLPVPHLFAWLCAMVIGVFGCAYAWLAQQPEIDRPLVVVAAIGKVGFFVISLICWGLGEVSIRIVGATTVDLAFAAVFIWWLLGAAQQRAPEGR